MNEGTHRAAEDIEVMNEWGVNSTGWVSRMV